MTDYPNLRGGDGNIGSPEPPRSTGDVYCNTCGHSGSSGKMDIYYPETDSWDRGVDCVAHNPVAH